MLLQGNQGQTGKSIGSNITAGFGEFSDLLATELQPRYYEQTYRGNVFSATFAAAALAAAASASSFVLVNPPNSGKNLVLIDAFVGLTVGTAQTASTSAVLGAAANITYPLSASSGGVTPACTLVGNANQSIAKAYATATLGVTPVSARQLASLYGDLAAGDFVGQHDDIAGTIVIAPGSAVAIFGLGGTPADVTVQPTLTWIEVPV